MEVETQDEIQIDHWSQEQVTFFTWSVLTKGYSDKVSE